MASSLARRLAEAAIAELRGSSLPVASSAPSLAVALLAAPSASSIHVSAARTTSPNAFYSVTFPAASAARSALGAKMCTSPEAAPSTISISISAAPPTSPTTFPAAPAASSALGAKMSCTSPKAAPSVISIFASAAPPTSPTNFHASTSPAALAASSALGSSPTPAPFRSLAAIGSGAEDDRCESGSVLVRFPSAIRNDRRNDRRYTTRLPPAIRNDRRYHTNWAWTPWEQTRPKEIPTSPLELDDILKRLNEIKLSHEEEVKFKTAFFQRLYSENNMDPKTVDLKLDLIMHKVDELTKLVLQAHGKKKTEWGTFVIFGRKIDLTKVITFLGLFFNL